MKLTQCLFISVGLLCAVQSPSAVAAAAGATAATGSAEPGVITGFVFNPFTREFVRDADVQVEGTNLATVSQSDGSFRLTGVPAGDVVVVATYTGYEPVRARLSLAPGAGATHTFELAKPLGPLADRDQPIVLGSFVVSSEREGNAKAIMNQRGSMNITNSVASDVFGDMTEGNIGDFLKNIPGMDIQMVEGEIRGVRLRGLGSEYTGVTLDGIGLASADANKGADGNARAFSFEQVSLSSMDAIEVSKTVSADVDANAPAGTINLKTKRAFDREGRRVVWQTNVSANSEALTTSRTWGPDNTRRRKLLPGGMFEYSDVFLNRRLGVVLNLSESAIFSNSARSTLAYNYTTTAADSRPVVPTTIAQMIGPRITERFTTTVTTDFRATPNLTLGLVLLYNYYDIYFHMRTTTFTLGTRTAVEGSDPLTRFSAAAANTTMSIVGQGVSKTGNTFSYVPKFEYKRGDFKLEGIYANSDSKNWYNPMGRRGTIFSSGTLTVAGVGFTGARANNDTGGWKLTQTKGPDWSDGANYRQTSITVNDGRSARNRLNSAELIATWSTKGPLPVIWKSGYKARREIRDFQVARATSLYTYAGPGAASGTGAWKDCALPFSPDLGLLDGASAVSSSGGPLYAVDVQKIATLFKEHPEYFSQASTLTASNYYAATYADLKHYVEDINAAYLMGTTKLGRAQFRAGLRWEGTATDSLDPDVRTAAELAAAGFAETNGRATTIPGIQYQYDSKPFIHHEGFYGKFFPSGSFKYRFTSHLDLHLGYSHTMRRPTFNDIAGVWTINDDALTVSAPNPKLTPETSDNLSARLSYYFEPVGLLAVSVFQNTVKGLFVEEEELSASDYGYSGGADLSGYTFNSTIQSAERVRLRGVEVEYSQSLSFLPKPFSGLAINASYTRNDAKKEGLSNWRFANMAANSATGGLSYSLQGVTVYLRGNWFDDTPTSSTGIGFRRHRFGLDTGGTLRLHRRVSLFWTVRNVLNAPFLNMQEYEGQPAVTTIYGSFGAACTFGLKGTF